MRAKAISADIADTAAAVKKLKACQRAAAAVPVAGS